MATPTATVFGGSGFVGRYTVGELARRGYRVRVAVRRPDRALFLKPLGDVGQITPVIANIRDDASVADAVAGADAAINLVGVLYEAGAQRFHAVHEEGAGRIARAAAAAGVERLVHVSAIGAAPDAAAAYARSKAAGEEAVRAAFPGAAIVRPSIVFGIEDDFLNRFAWIARISPALPLIGGGATRFQPVYVGDVADGIARIVADAGAAGRSYEFGGPAVYSFRELMEYLLERIGRRRLLLPVPGALAMLPARIMELAPVPPLLTRDQIRMLACDNVVGGDAPRARRSRDRTHPARRHRPRLPRPATTAAPAARRASGGPQPRHRAAVQKAKPVTPDLFRGPGPPGAKAVPVALDPGTGSG